MTRSKFGRSNFELKRSDKIVREISENLPAQCKGCSNTPDLMMSEKSNSLTQSIELFSQLLEVSPCAVMLVSLEGRIILCSRHAAEMYGFSSIQEMIGVDALELIAPEDRNRAIDNIKRIMKQEETLSIEYLMVRRDETTFPAERNMSVLMDNNGNPISFVCVVHDISKRKQMEDSLRESEMKFRQIIESAPVGVHMYVLDAQERLVFSGANPAADSLLRVDNSQFIGKTIEEAFPALADTEIPQRYREAALNGTSWVTEQVTYTDEQISGAFEVVAFQTSYRNMVAFFHDILNRKCADEEIENQRNFLERVINSLTHPFFVIDANDYTIKMANKAAMNNSIEPGMTCYKLSHGSDKPCREVGLVCPLDQIKITREPVIVEHNHIRNDGSDGIFQVFGYPIFDADGNLVEMIEYNIDVTDQRWAEDRLEMESKRSRLYLDVLAHDITNQLQVVLGNAELMKDVNSEKDVALIPRFADQIEKSVHKCIKIISEVQSTDHLWMTPLVERSLLKIFFECIETLAERDDEFSIELTYEAPDEIIMADKYLGDLINNLLSNALDHNSSFQKRIWVDLFLTSDNYVVTIADNGSGITNPMKHALFDPRQRVGGLGIHFSSEIVEKYGGSIGVHDRIPEIPEEGAMFKIVFPRVRRETISEAN